MLFLGNSSRRSGNAVGVGRKSEELDKAAGDACGHGSYSSIAFLLVFLAPRSELVTSH